MRDPAEGETGLRTATVYLPAVLLEQVKDAKEVAGTTFTAWILDQLDVHWDELDDLFDKPAPRTSPLPARGVARRRREVDTPQLLHLRVTQAELDVMEARSREVGAGSRSAFITEVARLGVQANADARPSRRRAGVR